MQLFSSCLAKLYGRTESPDGSTYENADDDTTRLVLADSFEDEENTIYPADFYAVRAGWLRVCTGENRRAGDRLATPEGEYLSPANVNRFAGAFAGGLVSDPKWANPIRLTRRGRVITALCRVKPEGTSRIASVPSTVRLEVDRGFVYRIAVDVNGWRELVPHVLPAFPEAAVSFRDPPPLRMFVAGERLGHYPDRQYSERDVGAYLDELDTLPGVFEVFREFVRERGWRYVGYAGNVAAIKPSAIVQGAYRAGLLAFGAAVTHVARQRAGIAHHFAGWFDWLRHSQRLEPNRDKLFGKKFRN